MKVRVFVVLFFLTAALFAQNIFVGQWSVDAGNYYKFNTDGTGGVSKSPEGNFIEDFSFLSWEGTGITTNYPRVNTLLLVSGSGTSPQDITMKLYSYTQESDGTVKAQDAEGNQLVFTRIAGNPAPLDVRAHPLLGQWEAKWNGGNHDGALGTWSFLYRTDGTVKAYHHRLHQFDNAYLVRGNILVILGEWRFHPAFPINVGGITVKGRDSVFVREAGGTTWDYKKKAKAAWKK
ncbi:MAG: hypothetical protein LBQ82_09810 [Treponema sp.]|jgi:hypothetical protein|nr:hypothetical protein [Treponema sp.]